MIKNLISNKIWHFVLVVLLSIGMTIVLFTPYLYGYFVDDLVFSGSGDGFRQMMPFQMYLCEHFTSLSSFYDPSFGLGGDYVNGLSYYYSLSPLMWLNFFTIWVFGLFKHINPSDISFWLNNQLIMAMVRTILTFMCSYYLFKYLKMKPLSIIVALILYGMSTVIIYFNFTWSFYGNILYLLPLAILGFEHFYQQRKIGIFIISITITLFSSFYFSYYQAIILGCYFIYRLIFQYKNDIVSRWQKFYILVIATFLSILSSSFGLYTGISAFLQNDRKQNPNLDIPLLTPIESRFLLFSDGFYITISIITIVALLSFKLYHHYFYRMFAVITWLLILGSASQYFDSAFNGFSMPQRRWVYALALSSSILIGLFIQYISELELKRYLIIAIPTALFWLTYYVIFHTKPKSLLVAIIVMVVIAILIQYHHSKLKSILYISLVLLILGQQMLILQENKVRAIEPYLQNKNTVNSSNYRSPILDKTISNINNANDDALNRIDYMSGYALNSPFIYHYNGISLYSSIFDGKILNYYDNQLQINMPTDKNSTYRLLGDRANLMALWNVQDRLRKYHDKTIPYGFKIKQTVSDNDTTWVHSKNTINYPSAHITNNIFNNSDLKSPLDKEQAMLQGVVLSDKTVSNRHFKANTNLLSKAHTSTKNAQWQSKHHLRVNKHNGGLTITLPKSLAQRYQDLYVEMDIELLSPDKAYDVKVNHYVQRRNPLTYQYRRFVTPVTMRIKSDSNIHIALPKGQYRLNLKGIYGEDYQTLKEASKHTTPVQVTKNKRSFTITKHQNDEGYIVLPMTYAKGMQAQDEHGHKLKVEAVNGIMTGIKVSKGSTHINLSYQSPHIKLLIFISLVGIFLSIVAIIFIPKLLQRKDN
ncbi:YfhO family protein [Staphylococcus simiae]|uniref:Integral membrane protein n=2 Tax=Staphylococcus simiae TaxID=308354 RepID=G5JLN1_9STAP|nr:YfhO family protein [Staphylococcus simiae]EHJ06911.1 hypothetical protein SS7213T_11992 [Staphylococcus simiae CCM 7213 = CCUG 51256]SNV69358.1 integral membrane protein [Staphylococcus simiae]